MTSALHVRCDEEPLSTSIRMCRVMENRVCAHDDHVSTSWELCITPSQCPDENENENDEEHEEEHENKHWHEHAHSCSLSVRFFSPHHGRGEGIQQQPGARLTMACFTLPPWHMTARKIFATGQCQREPTTSNLFCSIVTRDAIPSHAMSYAGCSALIALHETWQEPVLFR